jgi:hypothetical protein
MNTEKQIQQNETDKGQSPASCKNNSAQYDNYRVLYLRCRDSKKSIFDLMKPHIKPTGDPEIWSLPLSSFNRQGIIKYGMALIDRGLTVEAASSHSWCVSVLGGLFAIIEGEDGIRLHAPEVARMIKQPLSVQETFHAVGRMHYYDVSERGLISNLQVTQYKPGTKDTIQVIEAVKTDKNRPVGTGIEERVVHESPIIPVARILELLDNEVAA